MCYSFIEPRTFIHYESVVCPHMLYTCDYKTIMQLGKFTQIALNSSSKQSMRKNRGLGVQIALECIGGKQVKLTRARKPIAAFNLRKNTVLGVLTNLRNHKIYHFLDQFITISYAENLAANSSYHNLISLQDSLSLKTSKKTSRKKNILESSTGNNAHLSFNKFQLFPGLEHHFLLLSGVGGMNCTFSSFINNPKELALLLTTFQLPIKMQ